MIQLHLIYYIQNNLQKKISVVYKSKYNNKQYNNKRKKQVILLMIGAGKKYPYLAVTKLSGQ